MSLVNLFGQKTTSPWTSRTVWAGFIAAGCQFAKAAFPDYAGLIETIQVFALAGVAFFLRAGMLNDKKEGETGP